MRVRCIHLDNLKYKYLSIVQTESAMVVRVLYPMVYSDNRTLGDSDSILSDDSLLWQILDLNGDLFQVVAEGRFDLANPVHKQWFKSNANICFVANAAFPKGVISIVPQHLVCPNTYEHTPEWAKREGVTVLAQLYCWSDDAKINETATSFAVDNQGRLFTNIDPAELVHVDTEFMQRPDRSAFLTLQHNVLFESKDSCIEGTLQCFNNGQINNCVGTYLVECSAGYIPMREIHVENGQGTFVWYPLLLTGQTPVHFVIKDVQGRICYECNMQVSQ